MLREAEGERVYPYATRPLPAFAAGIVHGPVDVHVSGAQMADSVAAEDKRAVFFAHFIYYLKIKYK